MDVPSQVAALKYAVSICEMRSLPMYNASYKACAADIKIFLEAAIERLQSGEQMESLAYVQ